MLWAGSGDSLASTLLALISDEFKTARAEADEDRREFLAARAARHEKRQAVLKQVQSVSAAFRVDMGDEGDDQEEERKRYSSAPLTVGADGVGVISINGGLVSTDKWYLKYMGMVGYPHIQDSLVEAYKRPDVTSVVLQIKSPGGAVSGVKETGDAIRALNTFKPVSTFADGIMASGGYWLGSQTGDITAGEMSQLGSIGVIMTHLEYSKMLEQAGITATVMRKGEYKALLSPYEPLSDKARAQAQADMDFIYEAFTSDVARGMNVAQDRVKSSWGEGKVFWTDEAVSLGMANSSGSLTDAVAKSRQNAENRAKQTTGIFRLPS